MLWRVFEYFRESRVFTYIIRKNCEIYITKSYINWSKSKMTRERIFLWLIVCHFGNNNLFVNYLGKVHTRFDLQGVFVKRQFVMRTGTYATSCAPAETNDPKAYDPRVSFPRFRLSAIGLSPTGRNERERITSRSHPLFWHAELLFWTKRRTKRISLQQALASC